MGYELAEILLIVGFLIVVGFLLSIGWFADRHRRIREEEQGYTILDAV
jgi:hypothetical protein